MRGFNDIPIRTGLLLVVLVSILPALTIIVHDGIARRQQFEDETAASVSRLATSMPGIQERMTEGTRQLLTTLATTPGVRNLDGLKIDRSFVKDIELNADSKAIATAIVSMAKALNLSIVAEGVERETQLKLLLDLGCDLFQGFRFSLPVSAPDFEKLFAACGK